MNEVSYVVVFPNLFSKNKIPQLITQIKEILRLKNLKINSIKRDNDVILVDANDPVFASSAINLLFGIEKIAIARKTINDFQNIISEITSIAGNLLLKNERYLVKVEGNAKGFLVKDVEIAATAKIIEEKSNLGAFPGTENNYEKLLYTYLTKKNAYICIFMDKGNGGIPYNAQNKKGVCAIYDETSALACYETIKQGYDIRIIVCYRQKSELMNIVKIVNKILPRLLQEKINLEFFQINIQSTGVKNYLVYTSSIIEIMLEQEDEYLVLALSPLFFPTEFIENSVRHVFEKKKMPIIPLTGVDVGFYDDLKELGLEKNVKKVENIVTKMPKDTPELARNLIENSLKTKKNVIVKVGPNNIHDILDALK